MRSDISQNKHWLRDLIKASWNTLNFCRRLFLNIAFVLVLISIVIIISASKPAPVVVESNSILTLNLVGDIVEQKTFIDPYDEVISDMSGGGNKNPEMLLIDVLTVLEEAKSDDRIKALVLNLHSLKTTGLNKLQEIGLALDDFKTSGKPIIAYGDYYSQSQYYLAAHADELYLHSMGAISLDGFGRYRMYYKSALEKLKVNAHIFRVGTFKSAVEPFIRNDMSDAAKQANKGWLSDLWEIYKLDVAKARNIELSNFDETIDGFLDKFQQSKGSFADFAVTNNWVDGLKSHQELDEYLSEKFGKKVTYVKFNHYLTALEQTIYEASPDKVAVVVAKGTIYDGKRKPGEIGGQSTSELLKKARLDKSVKAVVLRVDSPGGSAFASELIRNEVDAVKAAGKPIVVSMSSLAASGGYWISTSADEIWAAPSTITGSIGIFGMFLTYEDSLKTLGVNTDGVATTEFNGLSAVRPLDPRMANIIQLAIEHGYDQFISLVATERNLDKVDVDNLAQGRVWSGQAAHKLGLVDNLGYFKDAIQSAANLAKLADYEVEFIDTQLNPMELFMQELFAQGVVRSFIGTSDADFDIRQQSIQSIFNTMANDAEKWTQMNDPSGAYIYCLECEGIE